MVKFADDVTLLVPENTDTQITDEFNSVKVWADANKMTINLSKTKEIVCLTRRPLKHLLPPILTGIERVVIAKLLDVFIDCHFRFSEHVDLILRQST